MIRQILESIAEVELDITPEFKKGPTGPTFSEVWPPLKEAGWNAKHTGGRLDITHPDIGTAADGTFLRLWYESPKGGVEVLGDTIITKARVIVDDNEIWGSTTDIPVTVEMITSAAKGMIDGMKQGQGDATPELEEPAGKTHAKINVIAAVRQAIFEVMGSIIAAHIGSYDYDPDTEQESWDREKVKDIIEKATYTSIDDPGQWAPESYVVIGHESGIPEAFDGTTMFEKWVKIGDRASELTGIPMFNESINPGVSAMWPK